MRLSCASCFRSADFNKDCNSFTFALALSSSLFAERSNSLSSFRSDVNFSITNLDCDAASSASDSSASMRLSVVSLRSTQQSVRLFEFMIAALLAISFDARSSIVAFSSAFSERARSIACSYCSAVLPAVLPVPPMIVRYVRCGEFEEATPMREVNDFDHTAPGGDRGIGNGF